MRAFLIDAENVNLCTFLQTLNFSKNDKFYIFGNDKLKFGSETLKILQTKFYKFYTFKKPSPNYADKMIFVVLGTLLNDDLIDKIFIVSKDKIFEKLDFLTQMSKKTIQNLPFEFKEKNDKTEIENFYKSKILEIEKLKKIAKNGKDFGEILAKFYGKNLGKNLADFLQNGGKIKTAKFGEIKLNMDFLSICENIILLRKNFTNNAEFHNELVKNYKDEGKEIYKIMKNFKGK